MSSETRERLSLRVSPVTSYRLHTAYRKSGRRTESVNNMKRTNGRISLEKHVREAWEDDDEWQD